MPVINEIDLPSARPDECKRRNRGRHRPRRRRRHSRHAKEGTGVREILEAVITPSIRRAANATHAQALIFDSWFDPYHGIVIVVRVIDGVIRPTKIRLMAEKQDYEVIDLRRLLAKAIPVDELGPGEVGFVVANIKVVSDAKIGDTVTTQIGPRPSRSRASRN